MVPKFGIDCRVSVRLQGAIIVTGVVKANAALRGFVMRALQTRGKVCEVTEVIGLCTRGSVGSGTRGDDGAVVALLYLDGTSARLGHGASRAASVQEASCGRRGVGGGLVGCRGEALLRN